MIAALSEAPEVSISAEIFNVFHLREKIMLHYLVSNKMPSELKPQLIYINNRVNYHIFIIAPEVEE